MKLSTKQKAILIFAAVSILVIALFSFGIASYLATTNHATGTPAAQVTATLTPSTTTPTSGDTWTLTVQTSTATAGYSVTLYDNSVSVQTGTTNAAGTAVFTVSPTAAYDYYATVQIP